MLGELRHFGDLLTRNARLYGGGEGLALGDERLSWRQSEARANRLAHALQARELCQGDRVGLLALNSVAFAESLFALARAGLVAVPVNSRLNAEEVAFILNDCEARGLLAGDEHLETARDAAGRAPSVSFVGGLGNGGGEIPSLAALLDKGTEAEPALERPIAGDDLLMLLYTSGTTGFPKGVMYTHRRALLGTLIHVLAIGSHRRHRVMLPSPLYSAAGLAGIACAVAVGSPTHLLRYSPEAALRTLERERITFTNLVPTTLKMLLEREDFGRYDLSSLEVLLYGGSPMPEPSLRRASEVLSSGALNSEVIGCGFRQTFATSETGLAGTVLEPEDHRAALADPERAHWLLSCGKPQVGVGMRLVDDDGVEVPDGEVGEVAVACDANMVGYWNRPEATAETLRDGWVHTGDLARRDEEGFFYIVDRKHDMIVSGALNVYPTEVERALATHSAVADCAVIGVPDERWGEAVKALVKARPGSGLGEVSAQRLASELMEHCRGRLAGFKRPKSVELVSDIPRTPTGKILRRLLREPYWKGQERNIG